VRHLLLQCVAVYCSVLQGVCASSTIVMPFAVYTAVRTYTLQCVAECCNMFVGCVCVALTIVMPHASYTDVYTYMLQCVVYIHLLQCVAVCCNVLQCVVRCVCASSTVAVCCSVLQCVAVCCSAL